jgi:carbamoyltransferase
VNILGIWGWSADSTGPTHESGACLLSDGKLVTAITEERLSRKKNDGSYPFKAIREVLRISGIAERDIDLISQAGLPPIARARRMLATQWQLYNDTGIVLPKRLRYALLTAKKIKRTLPDELQNIPHREWAHHHCHAASAFYTSPFDRATVITLDGIGDSSICGSISLGQGDSLSRLHEFNGYYSPGILYSYITKALGFKPARHEGKITGLAAYGDPEACYREFKSLIEYDRTRHQFFSKQIPALFGPGSEDLWSIPLVDGLLRRFEHKDIAAALQRVLEEEVVTMVADGLEKAGAPDLVLAGGVFSNVKLNQRIREGCKVRNIYIHPGMGDDGLMVGAAYLGAEALSRERGAGFKREFLKTVYLGPGFSSSEILEAARRHGMKAEQTLHIEEDIASHLAAGRVVGRFNGRMEYGPRALGNRTIMADPRDPRINESLNQRLKRTEFMPFAPSILEEDAHLYFKDWNRDHVAARFMTMTYDVFPKAQENCRAVVHVDGTARPQIVREEDNPSYYRTIAAYKRLTGLPIVVNTSFNIHEEPIVCTPDDALRSFSTCCVDILAMDSILISK